MRRIFSSLAIILLTSSMALAGPLFDDYLNYVRPGTGTGPGNAQISASSDGPVGQSFTVPAGTGEIYRIGVRPVYDTWQPGEAVTMALYDSPEKKQKLGEYVIDESTCRVDGYVAGNGSDFRHARDYVLYYQFRKPTEERTQFYFELTVTGGDGKVSFFGLDSDSYQGGKAYPESSVKDIAFECHIKPVADKQANLRKFFTERLDISHPELATVKAAVEAGNWDKAISETAKHFHNRIELWAQEDGSYAHLMWPKIDSKADTSTADLILQSKVKHADTKEPINWRKESWWVAVIPGAKQENKGIDPSPFLWHFDRALAGAYTSTGKEEYARGAIDLRMQFILDNPNPKVVYAGQEQLQWYFEIWNDRTAGARTPGHGDLVYIRLYNYPGWTDDERLVFFSFIEDNARWVYEATSGGNWGAEAARAAFDFGVNFPEWKMSRDYMQWGALRLTDVVMDTIRGDGVSHEAAVKYHGMVARRAMGLYKYHANGAIKLPDDVAKDMQWKLDGMYDHMAYTLQPKNYVVMCGDSWYENYAEPSHFNRKHFKDPKGLALKLRDGNDSVSAYLRSRLQPHFMEMLKKYDGKDAPSDEFVRNMNDQFNRIVNLGYLYNPQIFAGVKLRERTKRMLALYPHGDDLAFCNRWLIEDAYPNEITPGYRFSELYNADIVLNRPDFKYIASQGEEGTPPKDISKVYSESGYYIMRSDFGVPGRPFSDALHCFIHNGGWWGSHGHWDLTSINLYGFGRTLIIDPGQYSYAPPPGIDAYWNSKIHSMLVMEGRDCKREPGPSVWTSNDVIDWFDGIHYGFSNVGNVDYVRRKVAFVKPDYFLVDDSAKTTRDTEWTQVWNLSDPQARFMQTTGVIESTFARGGNIMILNQDPLSFDCTEHPGITATAEYRDTKIFRLTQKTANPRFQTLLYPYEAGKKPNVDWERIWPDDRKLGDLFYSLKINSGDKTDWAVFGEAGKRAVYRNGKNAADADFAVVRMDKSGKVGSFSMVKGRELTLNGKVLAKAGAAVMDLTVNYAGSQVSIDIKHPERGLEVWVGSAKNIILNGAVDTKPNVKNGMYMPFTSLPAEFVFDDSDCFQRITEGSEWSVVSDPNAWFSGFTAHETDPGRHENGDFVLAVPAAGRYKIEAYLPKVLRDVPDSVEYKIEASGVPAPAGGAVIGARKDGEAHIITVNQRKMAGWVTLGTFDLSAGDFKINVRNATEIDGPYFAVDAMRLVVAQ